MMVSVSQISAEEFFEFAFICLFTTGILLLGPDVRRGDDV